MSRRQPLRTLNINSVVYRWRCEWRWLGDRRIHDLRVWGVEKTGTRLDVTLESRVPYDETSCVLPSGVRSLVESALAAGWNPDARGKSYTLTPAHAPSLELLRVLALERGSLA